MSLDDIEARANFYGAAGADTAWLIARVRELEGLVEGLDSVRRCNDPMPGGDGMQLCDLWPDHAGKHATAEGFEWTPRRVEDA